MDQLVMLLRILGALALLTTLTASAEATGRPHARDDYRWRNDQPQPPVKDCTRFNGRSGYYGNPWCTEAEQLRWDRWEARRRSRLN
jgi:hypothetical protein